MTEAFREALGRLIPPSLVPQYAINTAAGEGPRFFILSEDPCHCFRQQSVPTAAYDSDADAILMTEGFARLLLEDRLRLRANRYVERPGSSYQSLEDDLFQFVLLHELGHRAQHGSGRHAGAFDTDSPELLSGMPPTFLQRIELEADTYALTWFLRKRLPEILSPNHPEWDWEYLSERVRAIAEYSMASTISNYLELGPEWSTYSHPALLLRAINLVEALAAQPGVPQNINASLQMEARFLKAQMQHLQEDFVGVVQLPAKYDSPRSMITCGDDIILALASDRLLKLTRADLNNLGHTARTGGAAMIVPLVPVELPRLNAGSLFDMICLGNERFVTSLDLIEAMSNDPFWYEPVMRVDGTQLAPTGLMLGTTHTLVESNGATVYVRAPHDSRLGSEKERASAREGPVTLHQVNLLTGESRMLCSLESHGRRLIGWAGSMNQSGLLWAMAESGAFQVELLSHDSCMVSLSRMPDGVSRLLDIDLESATFFFDHGERVAVWNVTSNEWMDAAAPLSVHRRAAIGERVAFIRTPFLGIFSLKDKRFIWTDKLMALKMREWHGGALMLDRRGGLIIAPLTLGSKTIGIFRFVDTSVSDGH